MVGPLDDKTFCFVVHRFSKSECKGKTILLKIKGGF